MNITQRKTSQASAFSLIEILLLISLVSVAFMGVSSLLRQTVQLEGLAKADFTANALADEGLALVKAMRSDNIAAGVNVFQDIAATGPGPLATHYFRIDRDKKNFITIAPLYNRDNAGMDLVDGNPTNPDARLNFDSNEYYSYSAGAASDFYRVISATPVRYGLPERYFVELSSTVTLVYRGKTYTYYRNTRLNDAQ
jgi:type II secretory pathway pseudopilin PulG